VGLFAVFGAWKGMKLVVRLVVLLVTALLAYLVVTAAQVWLTSRHSDAVASQAIVIMGAAQYNGVPSPDLLARDQEALSLYRRQLAPVIVATGSKQPADNYTEAQASAMWLEANGVPASSVLEVGGSDTWGSLSEAASSLHQRGLTRVLIVTDGFHEDRSLAIASDVGLDALPVPAHDSPISGWGTVPYFFKETLGVAVGRIVGYSHLHSLGARVGS
jgi:uncharacterized SAM-binding protein YcdF (DUF218 family)